MKKLLALSALLLLTGAGCVSQNKTAPDIPSSPVACTMEAKQCPDGSYVGRTGPNCEFSACPATTAAQTYKDWKTHPPLLNLFSLPTASK